MRPVLALILCAAGCFSVDIPDGVIACGEAGCPPGMQCASDGTCRRSPLANDAGPDAAIPIDGAPADAAGDAGSSLACSSVAMLADDFDDGSFGDQWGYSYGTPTSRVEESGMAVFPVEAQTWSAYASTYDYDLTGASLTVRVVDVGVGPNIYTFVGVRNQIDGDDPVARIIHFEGEIYAETRIDGVSDRFGDALLYDPDQHRYWRLREDGGILYWEVSADGSNWTELASRAPWFDVRHLRAEFGVGTDSTAPPATTARFDDFNGGVAAGQACPVSTVSDDFADPAATAADFYLYSWGACSASVSTGTANIALTGTEYGECQWISRRGLDLTGGQVSMEAEQSPAGTGEYGYLGIKRPNGDFAHLITWEGMIYGATDLDGVVTDFLEVPYQPAQHRYWRLRVTGGRLFADVSADGLDWTSTDMGTPFPLDEVQVYFGAGTIQTTSVSANARFDDLNILP